MLTGDAAVNAGALIIACTAEVLANIALREGAEAGIGPGGDGRVPTSTATPTAAGLQVPLLELPGAQFLLMSATSATSRSCARTSPVAPAAHRARRLRGTPCAAVPRQLIRDDADARDHHRAARHQAVSHLRRALHPAVGIGTGPGADERQRMHQGREGGDRRTHWGVSLSTAFGSTLSRLVRHGIGVHHAGMLPKYRRLVEQLAQAGLLKVICGTDTLGVGINVPIRTVVFSALSKYDGTRSQLLNAREFHQIAGRAGRAGSRHRRHGDRPGPDHEVENLKQFAKVADDPRSAGSCCAAKPPRGWCRGAGHHDPTRRGRAGSR